MSGDFLAILKPAAPNWVGTDKFWLVTLVDSEGRYVTGAIDQHPADFLLQEQGVVLLFAMPITEAQYIERCKILPSEIV